MRGVALLRTGLADIEADLYICQENDAAFIADDMFSSTVASLTIMVVIGMHSYEKIKEIQFSSVVTINNLYFDEVIKDDILPPDECP